MAECLICAPAVCNISEMAFYEYLKINGNTTIGANVSASTSNANYTTLSFLVDLYLKLLFTAVIFLAGLKIGTRRGYLDLIILLNRALIPQGAFLQIIAGNAVIQPIAIGQPRQPVQPHVVKPPKKKKKFKPPIWSPPSRTPCIPKN